MKLCFNIFNYNIFLASGWNMNLFLNSQSNSFDKHSNFVTFANRKYLINHCQLFMYTCSTKLWANEFVSFPYPSFPLKCKNNLCNPFVALWFVSMLISFWSKIIFSYVSPFIFHPTMSSKWRNSHYFHSMLHHNT